MCPHFPFLTMCQYVAVVHPTYNKKLTPKRPNPPIIMPKTPAIFLRPTTLNETDAVKTKTKNHSEFHHLAVGALKQTTNHSNPAIANITPARPYTFCLCDKTTSCKMRSFAHLPTPGRAMTARAIFPLFHQLFITYPRTSATLWIETRKPSS